MCGVLHLYVSVFQYSVQQVSVIPRRWGTAVSWRWGLRAPRILQIPFFKNLKERRLQRVPQFGPQSETHQKYQYTSGKQFLLAKGMARYYHNFTVTSYHAEHAGFSASQSNI